jgi:bifunctional aspartokinase / homoserine dehydrogenase 1
VEAAMEKTDWYVHKFGGTSLANAKRYQAAAQIIKAAPGERAVVVSAMAGTTDTLIHLLNLAQAQDGGYRSEFGKLLTRHRETISTLLHSASDSVVESIIQKLESDAKDIEDVLRVVWLTGSYSEELVDYVSGYGEIWSAQILTAFLNQEGQPALFVDARRFLTVDHLASGPRIHADESKERLSTIVNGRTGSQIMVVTGYIARDSSGKPTTLKRNGSDFSASIIGALLSSRSITIWTDVSGVMSADPRKVPNAVVSPELSYHEAAELAYFGAKVIHPSTMGPAINQQIPIFIKNALDPKQPGSRIHLPQKGECAPVGHAVRGFATVDEIALVNLEGTGMIGVPGIAEKVFRNLSDVGVSVVMISQASSEHSICVAVPISQGKLAQSTLEDAFLAEIKNGRIQTVDVIHPCSILAAVGDRMAETPGVAGRFFGALGKAGINIRAVAQGSSERNISVVVDQKDAARGLQAVHAAFYLSDQTISVGLVGPGLIGQALLAQLQAQHDTLKEKLNLDFRIRGIASSTHMQLWDDNFTDSLSEQWKEHATTVDLDLFRTHIQTDSLPHAVIIDCTASDHIAAHTPSWLENGVHVVTPNKKAASGPLALIRQLDNARKVGNTHFFSEATVGAGLPVLSTLRDLLKTGDHIFRIEGVLSGTLSHLFNSFDGSVPFSELVEDARIKGYTEPDPRDDLSGMDVARKAIILAREMGWKVELKDIPVESLVPAHLQETPSVEDFLKQFSDADPKMKELLQKAEAEDAVLRYVASIDEKDGCKVELKRYPKSHAFARISGSDNILAFTTTRYQHQPLIVQGPGAGPEVTAGGVFSDLLRLAAHLGARS